MANGITSHSVVLNEEQWIWYSLNSVLPYVDRMLVYDVGSTDRTVEIIKSIKSKKIDFRQIKQLSPEHQVSLRQQQLDETKTPWFLLLDGDEIWYRDSIKKVVDKIKNAGNSVNGIVTPTINFLGDLYHVEEERAGRYEYLGKRGHLALRAIRKTPGLHLTGVYPLEDYIDASNKSITRDNEHLVFEEAPYCHMTNLLRSASREKDKGVFARQYKLELGDKVNSHFIYPEIFYSDKPEIVPDPWIKMTTTDLLLAALLTPAKKFKRRIL